MHYTEEDGSINSAGADKDGYEDISSGRSSREAKRGAKKKKSRVRALRNFLIAVICLLTAIGVGFYIYAYSLINKASYTPLDSDDLGIDSEAEPVYDEVRNIALLGLDTRQDNDVGRSDAIIVLTVDKKHGKIKLTSIARDSYVEIDGHSMDKLTHAYAYGRSQLAVKTLNTNFGLEIKDYVTVNFFGLAEVIDYIGGVYINVTEAEKESLNDGIFSEMRTLGMDCPNLNSAGEQLLNGAQAVGYARIRYIDSDVQRGNRQKTVLSAMLERVKDISVFKLPQLAQMVLENCETSLSANDIIALGTWGITSSPDFDQLSVPNDNIPSEGKIIGGVWYYVIDIQAAANDIHDFIFEENAYSD